MGEVSGFRSKYERAEFVEMANASLSELEALEKKYSDVLSGNEYAFSKNAEEEGHKIFSRLLVAVREKIAEVKTANAGVKAESWKRRTALSTEITGKRIKRPAKTPAEAVEPTAREPKTESAPEFVTIPLAPEPRKADPTNVKKSDLDGFAWWVRGALKDMGSSASKFFGNSK